MAVKFTLGSGVTSLAAITTGVDLSVDSIRSSASVAAADSFSGVISLDSTGLKVVQSDGSTDAKIKSGYFGLYDYNGSVFAVGLPNLGVAKDSVSNGKLLGAVSIQGTDAVLNSVAQFDLSKVESPYSGGWFVDGSATKVTLSAYNDLIYADKDGSTNTMVSIGTSGADTINFSKTGTTGATIKGSNDGSIKGSLLFTDGKNELLLGKGSNVSIGTAKGVSTAGGITLAGFNAMKSATAKGSVSLDASAAATIDDFNITSGTTALNATQTVTFGSTGVSVTDGAALVADSFGTITGGAIKGGTFTGGAYASGETSDVKVTLSASAAAATAQIDDKNRKSGAMELTIESLGGTFTETLSARSETKLNLTGTADTTKSFVAMDNSQANAVSLLSGSSYVLKENSNKSVDVTAGATGVEWNIKDVKGAANIVASAKDDTITSAITSASAVVKAGDGNDTLIIKGTKGTFTGGKGDDIYDVTSATGGYVDDFGSGKTKSTAVDASNKGYDKIYIGNVTAWDENSSELKNYKVTTGTVDTSVSVIKFNGVEFNVSSATDGFIQLGFGETAASASYYSYQMTENGLSYMGEVKESSDTDEPYNKTSATSAAFNLDQSDTDVVSVTKDAANATAADYKSQTGAKFLNMDGALKEDITMSGTGTNYIIFKKDAVASGNVKMSGSKYPNVIGFVNNGADISGMSISGYKSTTDVLVGPKDLKEIQDSSSYTMGNSTNFINAETGLYGTDIAAKNGVLGASQKGSSKLYEAKYRVGIPAGNTLPEAGEEVIVVAGSTAAGKASYAKTDESIFALLDNNSDVADSVVGSTSKDYFIAGAGDTVEGGKGDDYVNANGQKVTVVLGGKGEGADVVDKAAKVTVKMASGKTVSDFVVSGMEATGISVYTNGAATDGSDTATFNGLGAAAGSTAEMTLADSNGSYDALLLNNNEADVTVGDDDYNKDVFVGVKGKTGLVDFGTSEKQNIILGGKDGAWGDNATYVNVNNVKSSNIGNTKLFNDSSSSATLTAGGADDSLYGGSKAADSLVSNSGYRTFFGTNTETGKDTISGFLGGYDGVSDTATDVVYFLGGTSHMALNKNSLVVGSSIDNNVTFANDDGADEMKVNFGFELGGPISTALVGLAEKKELTYDENANWFIGWGSKTSLKFDDEKAVQFGWKATHNGIRIGKLDGSNAAAGSIINGSDDCAQTVIGSANGASSIAGGVNDQLLNTTNDTLVGGGVGQTTFFVGKNLGNDTLTEISNGDTIVFLSTKLSDITGLNVSENANSVSVSFEGGKKIEGKLKSGLTMGTLTNTTFRFDDGDYVYSNGGFVAAPANTATV